MPSKESYRAAVRQLLEKPEWRRMAFEALDVLNRGNPSLVVVFPDSTREISFRDIYCQGPSVSYEDQVLTAVRWQSVLRGHLIYGFIQVREAPHRDRDLEANRSIVADMVDRYRDGEEFQVIAADFWGGNHGEDGFVRFAEPFITNFSGRGWNRGSANRQYPETAPAVSGVRTDFPLEVGDCLPDQMEAHFAISRCVARLPYGSDVMVFLEAMPGFFAFCA